MKLLNTSHKVEACVIRGSIILFWWLFWLLNVIDKIIGKTSNLFVGSDYLAEFTELFESIGIDNPFLVEFSLWMVGIIEGIALIFITIAFIGYIIGNRSYARSGLFWGIAISLLLFTGFIIGDQLFGARGELLEHSIYWLVLLVSWFVYSKNDFSHSMRSMCKQGEPCKNCVQK